MGMIDTANAISKAATGKHVGELLEASEGYQSFKGIVGGIFFTPTLTQDLDMKEDINQGPDESVEDYQKRVLQGVEYDDRPEAVAPPEGGIGMPLNTRITFDDYAASSTLNARVMKRSFRDELLFLPWMLTDRQSDQLWSVISGDQSQKAWFPADPTFDLKTTIISMEDTADYEHLATAQSMEEYIYLKGALGKHKTRADEQAASRSAYMTGQLLAVPMRFSSAMTLGVGTGSKGILRSGRNAAAVGFIEEKLNDWKDPYTERNALGYAANVFVFNVGTAALFAGAKNIYSLRRADGTHEPLEDVANHEAILQAELDAGWGGRKAFKDPDGMADGNRPPGVDDFEPQPKGVGAEANPSSVGPHVGFAERVYNEGLKASLGVGQWTSFVNPILRVMHGSDLDARTFMQDLFEVAPRLNKNTAAGGHQATGRALETELRMDNNARLGTAQESMANAHNAYLERHGTGPLRQTLSAGGAKPTGVGDEVLLTFGEFRDEIARAMRRGGSHPIKEIEDLVPEIRKHYDDMLDEGLASGIFTDGLRRMVKAIDEMDNPTPASQLKRAELETQIEKIETELQAGRNNYVNRMWDDGAINARWDDFVNIVQRELQVSRKEAIVLARQLQQEKSFVHTDADPVGVSSALRARRIQIPNEEAFDDFLINDMRTLLESYIRTTNADLKLYNRFGSVDLESASRITGEVGPIETIRQNYNARIEFASRKTGTREDVLALEKERDAMIEDFRATRDLLRWTYAIPPNPSSMVSRSIRMAKNFAAMTMLTGALAALPDVARVIAVDGLRRSMGRTYEGFLDGMKLLKMSKEDARAAGEVWEMVLNSRAALLADVGDLHGMANKMERRVSGAAAMSFAINGMSLWNDIAKNVTALNVGSKILQDVEDIMSGTASSAQRERIAASTLTEGDVESIWSMRDRWHRSEHNIIGQTSSWTNKVAEEAYLSALSKEINSVIITPGLGEKPLFTSQEGWSLVTQFKSFAFASHMKATIPILQERDMAAFTQLAGMVALGGVVAYLRAVQNDQEKNFGIDDFLVEGFDRSGAGGWMMDINNMAERASGNNIGIRPLTGTEPPYQLSETAVATSIAGPAATQAMKAFKVTSQFLSGNWNRHTTDNFVDLIPTNNFAQFDNIFDAVEEGIEGVR